MGVAVRLTEGCVSEAVLGLWWHRWRGWQGRAPRHSTVTEGLRREREFGGNADEAVGGKGKRYSKEE